MPKGASTRVIDHGWKALVTRLKTTKGSYVKIGVQTGTIRKPEPGEPGGQSMAEIYAANEFGTAKIPARPTLRPARDETRAKTDRILEGEKDKILAGTTTARRTLAVVGLYVEQAVKAKIRSDIPPPNAPSTVRRKQRRKPGPVKTLVDYGQLHQSIRYVVVMK